MAQYNFRYPYGLAQAEQPLWLNFYAANYSLKNNERTRVGVINRAFSQISLPMPKEPGYQVAHEYGESNNNPVGPMINRAGLANSGGGMKGAINLLKRYCNINNLNISMFILSTEKNKVVNTRAKKLELECLSGKNNKLQTLNDRFKSERPNDKDPFAGLIYFGNDLNDLPVILKAGLSFAPSDAHFRVKESSTYVLNRMGGHDFVREGVEFLIDLKSMSPEELNEFVSNC
jgi:3-deoxy-D-manno-octulosonate 8-phosphate phosphatase KdsC-like HAD superfamily phosphatase